MDISNQAKRFDDSQMKVAEEPQAKHISSSLDSLGVLSEQVQKISEEVHLTFSLVLQKESTGSVASNSKPALEQRSEIAVIIDTANDRLSSSIARLRTLIDLSDVSLP